VNRGVTLQWEPPEAGGAITSYAVRVSGALDGVLHTTERVLSRELSPGTYIVQVSAVNPCGTSALSAARAVVIP
jgi:hypothetical protein